MVTTPAAPRNVIAGKVLLGWMDREPAVNFLMNDCVFDQPFNAQDAERKWREYRDRAEALPEREIGIPERLQLSHDERRHADRFLAFVNSLGPHTIEDVIKVDLSKLVAHQLYVAVARSQDYVNRVRTTNGWLHEALPLVQRAEGQIRTSFSVNGLHSAADIDLPHAECAFLPDPGGRFFSVQQFQSYISVMRGDGRMLLKAGYHRSYARALSMMPTATVPSAVVALERNTFVGPPNQVAGAGAGLIVATETAGLRPTGRRPAFFADFFTDGFFMSVNLRRKRYQLQVRSTWVALDDSA